MSTRFGLLALAATIAPGVWATPAVAAWFTNAGGDNLYTNGANWDTGAPPTDWIDWGSSTWIDLNGSTQSITGNLIADWGRSGTLQNGTLNVGGWVNVGSGNVGGALILKSMTVVAAHELVVGNWGVEGALSLDATSTLTIQGANIGSYNSGGTAPGKLSGTGTINSTDGYWVNIGSSGTIDPGLGGIGTLHMKGGMLNLMAGSASLIEITKVGSNLTGDAVVAEGHISFGGTLQVDLLAGSDVLAAGDSWQIFSAPGLWNDFGTKNLPTLSPGLEWQFAPATGVLSVTAVPEPATLAAGGLLLAGLGMRRRR